MSMSLAVAPARSRTRAAPSAPYTPAKPAPTIKIFCDMILALSFQITQLTMCAGTHDKPSPVALRDDR